MSKNSVTKLKLKSVDSWKQFVEIKLLFTQIINDYREY